MKDFIAAEDRPLLEKHGLAGFDPLWELDLTLVDEPNVERGGISCVYRLELDEASYYLKRQTNHLTRSLTRPFGEPTFAREFRNIRLYRERGIPALDAAFYGERKAGRETRAMLMTRALDGWRDLHTWLAGWARLPAARRQAILDAVGELARRLHDQGQVHGCFYPKHIFLRERGEGFEACLIDLEKTRPLRWGRRDRIRDLEPLVRRASGWGPSDLQRLLSAYLPGGAAVDDWCRQLLRRRSLKEAQG
ncbi:lipopolysaccharide kinase InaA family protein [Stutzerimonas tarimensis]|uniref:Lipopolysaccharide kinase InaA family protein n=1 Tax=Stutzerimonas tarimensis TaxID=1507735 RepID=A0ABV7T6G1_9GAMM